MTTPTGERADLLDLLAKQRYLFTVTVRGLTDEQARLTPIPSTTLSLGGLVKHVTLVEAQWQDFVLNGPGDDASEPDHAAWAEGFVLGPDETLDRALAAYRRGTERTDDLVRSVDLDLTHPLPAAPWNPPGATHSARRVFTHIAAETAQHAGHADLLREAIDGQKTMG